METKSKVAAHLLLSWGTTCGLYLYTAAANFLMPEVEMKQKVSTYRFSSWGPMCGRIGYTISDVLGVPEVETIKYCLITPTLLGLPETERELEIST